MAWIFVILVVKKPDMADLRQDWLTDGRIDFEYKKYLLLAYMQHVDQNFDAKKLYPNLSELLGHYKNLETLKEQKKLALNSFPKEITKLDFEKFTVEYKNLFQDDDTIREIDEIISFALPQFRHRMSAGRELYEEVEDKIEIFPVGVLPLKADEGYFLISDFIRRAINAYYYNITIFESAMERFRGIQATLIGQYDMSVANTYQHIKYQLIKDTKDVSAMYALEFKQSFPLAETMLPVAKRMLVRYVTTA
jgi:hypothetical protein